MTTTNSAKNSGTDFRRVFELVSAQGGLIENLSKISPIGHPYQVYGATLGELGKIHTNIDRSASRASAVEIGGSGGGTDPELARGIAAVEAIERHANSALPSNLLWSDGSDLEGAVFDIGSLPTCSEQELASPHCPVLPYAAGSKIRWTRGWSLTAGVPVWVPASLVWLHGQALTPNERFTLPISTGAAAHSSIEAAVRNGIREVVERDAIALAWLQQLELPEIIVDGSDNEIDSQLMAASDEGRTYRFFDATTDLGIPTVYCVETDACSSALRNVVMCDTNPDFRESVRKILRELAASRLGLATYRFSSENPFEFTTVYDGALHMGRAERADAFEFLLHRREPKQKVHLDNLPVRVFESAIDELGFLLHQLAVHGMEVTVVDITTREAELAGIVVVKVVIPELMPLSFVHAARFLAHSRLYDAPVAMGYRHRSTETINPHPQPFA